MKLNGTKTVIKIALILAVMCAVSPLTISIPFSPVPLSLTTLIIYISLFLLETKQALLCIILYIFIGIVGLPVFSNFSSGIYKIFGPTGGYIIGYIFLVLVANPIIMKNNKNIIIDFLGLLVGTIICYAFGTIWICYQMSLHLIEALIISVVPFIVGDIIKMGIAIFIGRRLQNILKF